MLVNLNLPKYDFKLKRIDGSEYIFDEVRKKYIKLTPEEWVRQNLVHYLNIYKKYPVSLMSLEHALVYNGMKKRADIVCFDTIGKPLVIVECKASSVKISQKVFEQIARYNFDLKVEEYPEEALALMGKQKIVVNKQYSIPEIKLFSKFLFS